MFDPQSLILKGEDPGILTSLIDEARALFQPTNGFEMSIVDDIAHLHYRKRRMSIFECGLLRFERFLTPRSLIRDWPGIDEAGRNTLAMVCMRKKLKDFLGLESILSRLLHQALKSLELLRNLIKPAKPTAAKQTHRTRTDDKVLSKPEKTEASCVPFGDQNNQQPGPEDKEDLAA